METKRRPKRMYVYWGIALTLLVTVGLVCLLVVVPVWQVRKAVGSLPYARCADVLSDTPDDLVRQRVRELGGPEEAMRKILFYLRMPAWAAPNRKGAVCLLGGCGEPAVPTLIEHLEHPNGVVCCKAALALSRIGAGARAAVPALTKQLESRDNMLRMACVSALGSIGAKETIPILVTALKDEDAHVRRAAAKALKKIRAAQKKEGAPK